MSTLLPYSGDEETKNFMKTALFAAVCFLLVHLLLIFRFGLSCDEIWDLTGSCSGIYLAGGRFTVSIYRLIFSPCGVPVAYGIAAALFWGLSAATQLKILQIQDKWLQFLFIAFSVSVIQLSYFMVCCYHADAICLGLFMVSCSYLFFEKAYKQRSKAVLCLSIVPAVIGIGAYQFLALLLPSLFLIQLLQNQILTNKQESLTRILRKAGIFGGWFLCVITTYFILSTIGKTLCPANDLNLTESYQSKLILWGKLDIITHILHMGKAWCLHLIGVSYSGEWLYASALFPLIILLHDIWKKDNAISLRLFYIFLTLCLYVIPFIPILILGRDIGPRLFITQPLTCAALWSMALVSHAQILKHWGILSLGIFVMLKACYTVSDMAFYQKRLFEEALILRNEVIARALQAQVPTEVDVYSCPILVYNDLITSIRKQDRYGSPIPACGHRAFDLYLDMSVSNMRKIYRHEKEFIPIFKQMPVYPAPGSIKYHEGKILVKLGD